MMLSMAGKTRWALWCVFVAVWTGLLLMPAGPVLGLLTRWEFIEAHKYLLAKSLHVAAYAVMTILTGSLQFPARIRWLPIFFLMAHATLTEILQLRIEGRTGTLYDVGYDEFGIALGIALSWKWWVKKEAC